MITTSNIGAPVILPTVNVATEQVHRENQLRQQIVAPADVAEALKEKELSNEEKEGKRSSWDPTRYPNYDLSEEKKKRERNPEDELTYSDDEIERLLALLDPKMQDEDKDKYVMRVYLPKYIRIELQKAGVMARRRTVINYRYKYSTTPNLPSEHLGQS